MAPAKVHRLSYPIRLDKDVLDLRRVVNGDRLLEWTVQYRIRWRDGWAVVVRYDDCHGGRHRHDFWRSPPEQRQPLDAPGTSLSELFDAARDDLLANWQQYRTAMVDHLRQLSYGGGDP
ncbi:MAG: DUF7718 family protein [Thermoplasmatota archaeon]